MECERCHRNRAAGRTYTFHYGWKGATETSLEWGAKVRRTPYKIAGRDGAWICGRCVNLFYVPSVAVGVAALTILLLASLYPEVNPANAICCGAIGVGVLAISLLSRREIGEWLAVRVRRDDLTSQGYNAFLTSLQSMMLQKDA